MFGYGLHDGTVDDDEMFGRCLDVASLARIARVEEQRRPLEANPVAAPSALPGQLHLMFLTQKPLLDAQEPVPVRHHDQEREKKREKSLLFESKVINDVGATLYRSTGIEMAPPKTLSIDR